MSKRIFSKEQIEVLLQNPNVLRCSEKSITYHRDFKVRSVGQYQDGGLSAMQIFKQAGFNVDIVGRDTPKESLGRWIKTLKKEGLTPRNWKEKMEGTPLGSLMWLLMMVLSLGSKDIFANNNG